MHPERKGAQAAQATAAPRGGKGESSQPVAGKAGNGPPTGTARGANRQLQRVPSIANRLTASGKGKDAHAAPASLLDPALKLRRPGKDDISYNRVLNKAGILMKSVTKSMPGQRRHIADDWGVWLSISADGNCESVKVHTADLKRDLGLQPRDLRLLDPALSRSYPSAILAREAAILFKMEHIKCIITRDHVLLEGAEQPKVQAFAEELSESISSPLSFEPSSADLKGRRLMSRSAAKLGSTFHLAGGELPFELRVLESALYAVCSEMETRMKSLEAQALPCFQMHTRGKVLDDFLERLRHVKVRIGSLRTKIETMKEVLEDFLDDEDDMLSLNLTSREKRRAQPAEEIRRRRVAARLHHLPESFSLKERTSFDSRNLPVGELAYAVASYLEHTNSFTEKGGKAGLETVEELEEEEQELDQIEMLLETYFMQLDQLFDRLQDMKENIEATATMLDLELDNYRNNIIRVRLTTNSATCAAGLIFSITGCMAMMLGEGKALESEAFWAFALTSTAVSGGSVVLLGIFLLYLHRHGLGLTNLAM